MTPMEDTEADLHTDTKNHTMVHSGALLSHYLLRPLSATASHVVPVASSIAVRDHNGNSLSLLTPWLRTTSAPIHLKPSEGVSSRTSHSTLKKHTSISIASAEYSLLDNSTVALALPGGRARNERQILGHRSRATKKAVRGENKKFSDQIVVSIEHRSLHLIPTYRCHRELRNRAEWL
ncbi:uncharacterized protein LOC131293317 [Anopheles ziemanni]|uniref:uncharacterized protein LOC131267183 n=1 Tax=Anopheles coustani TaxID=139045 RepID=UPI0026591EA1|nr:uncharacterized protein LOC131267183 [Anopheles coustani]XP_058177383.1 uncharacterized protein LOC131293317 [Anopheles ziemanni]